MQSATGVASYNVQDRGAESLALARRFRYYGKKRGHRRTGSPALAGVAEAVFSAFFVLLGLAGLMLVLSGYVVPEWRANHEFVETTCRVLAKQIGEKDFGEGPLYRPEVKIQYEVGGVEYRDWHYDVQRAYSSSREDAQANLDQFELYATGHKTYSCWYDPANPSVAVLVRGYGWVSWLDFHRADFVHHHRGRRFGTRGAALGQVGRAARVAGAAGRPARPLRGGRCGPSAVSHGSPRRRHYQ